jgi:hypothetical protein
MEENRQFLSENGSNHLKETEWKDGTSLCNLTARTSIANTSGRKGVSFNARSGKWGAYIRIRGKQKRLGHYSKFEDAVKARERAEEELFEPVLNAYGRTLYEPEISKKG